MVTAAAQLKRFAWSQLRSCVFAAGIFTGLIVTELVPLPIARYDLLLVWCLALTALFWATGLESWREVLVVCAFHLLGLGLELFKVHVGSWAHPEDALTKVAGVPLYSGFMYAAVGSYICQAWHRFELRVDRYRAWPTTVVAIGIYANFFTHHWLPDLRLPLALASLLVLRRATVHFWVGMVRYRMPLTVAYLLIGVFLWAAENAATFLGAWAYPHQVDFWRAVHVDKIGSWALLVIMSFVLVAAVKAQEGILYSRPSQSLGAVSKYQSVPSIGVTDVGPSGVVYSGGS